MKAVLISFFNSNNIGDLLITEMLSQLINPFFEVVKLDYSENLKIENNLRVNKNIKPKSKISLLRFLLYKIKFNIKIKPYKKIIKDCDILFIGGGNMIFSNDKYSKLIYKFKRFVKTAKLNHKKVYAISLGIGPFFNNKQESLAIKLLSKCDYITFRDPKSLQIYNKYKTKTKAYLSIDPVFYLPFNNKQAHNFNIGINIINNNLINNDSKEYEFINNNYINLIEEIRNNFNGYIYLFSSDLKDYPAIYDVYEGIINKENIFIEDITGTNSLLFFYQKISFLIGTRMHAMIIAYTQYIPFIGFSWQQKIDAFFDIIKRRDYCFDYKKINENINIIVSKCEMIINNLQEEQGCIRKDLMEIRRKYNIDIEILKDLV